VSSSSGAGGSDAGTCGLTIGGAGCDACLASSCCAVEQACADDPACKACAHYPWSSCSSNAAFNAFQSCYQTSCSIQCGGGSSASSAYGPPPPPPPPEPTPRCGGSS
jgi:hypothetical protein